MSERARAALARKWRHLEFFTVDHVVARDPEDVQYIELRKPPIGTYPDGTPMYNGVLPSNPAYKRLTDVPEAHRAHARVVWESFHGYTTSGARFSKDRHNELDFHADLTLDYGQFLNHTGISELPTAGQTICGEPEAAADGTTILKRWFTCDSAFRLLVTSLRQDLPYSETEYAHLLLTKGYPDTYFAIARLVHFDNVQAFVDAIRIGSPAPTVSQLFMGAPPTISSTPADFGRHPAFGKTYASGWPVNWRGMNLATGYAQFVHELSHILDEPAWWDTFLRLAGEQGVLHSHPDRGGVCGACAAADPAWFDNGFPYQFDGEGSW
jgi:hypothetical protein